MLAFVLGAILVVGTAGTQFGAPVEACADMVPQHDHPIEDPATNPYTVSFVDNGDGTYGGQYLANSLCYFMITYSSF